MRENNTTYRRRIKITELPLTDPQIPLASAKIATDVARDVKGRSLLERGNAIPPCALFQPLPDLGSGVLGEALSRQDCVLMQPSELLSELICDNIIHACTPMVNHFYQLLAKAD